MPTSALRAADDDDATGDALAKRFASERRAAAASPLAAPLLAEPYTPEADEDWPPPADDAHGGPWGALAAFYGGGGGGVSGDAALPRRERECPELYAGPLSFVYFAWVTPLVKLGFKRPLEQVKKKKNKKKRWHAHTITLALKSTTVFSTTQHLHTPFSSS